MDFAPLSGNNGLCSTSDAADDHTHDEDRGSLPIRTKHQHNDVEKGEREGVTDKEEGWKKKGEREGNTNEGDRVRDLLPCTRCSPSSACACFSSIIPSAVRVLFREAYNDLTKQIEDTQGVLPLLQ